jgi:hypothetical protein
MKRHLWTVLLFIACSSCFAAPPSDESLEKLIEAMGSRNSYRQFMSQAEVRLREIALASSQKPELSPEERATLKQVGEEMARKGMEVLNSEFTWNVYKAIYMEMYRGMFSQENVDNFIKFYTSPDGKALISNLPGITRKISENIEERLAPVFAKIDEALDDVKAAHGYGPPGSQQK